MFQYVRQFYYDEWIKILKLKVNVVSIFVVPIYDTKKGKLVHLQLNVIRNSIWKSSTYS